MKSPFYNLRPPYRLPSNIIYFHDWRYVQSGAFTWTAAEGASVPMMGTGLVPPMRFETHRIPYGIHLEAEPARKSECVLDAKATGDAILFGGSQIKEDGVHRLWYEAWLARDFGTPRIGVHNALRYAESDDGVHWRLPKNNIVWGADQTPTGLTGACVFRDPTAETQERYKSLYLGVMTAAQFETYQRERRDEIDPLSEDGFRRKEHAFALYGATSPDGLHWKALPDPLLMINSDTHITGEYDPLLGQYVAYVRTWFFKRGIGRTMSPDFRRFPLPDEVLWPGPSENPFDSWYANAKTVMPHAPEYHVMFPMRWSMPTDSFEFHLATSPDNLIWNVVPGGAVCRPGERSAWDAGVVAPGHGLVEWGSDKIGLLYCGTPFPHKHPRRPPLGGLAWAWWPKGRLVALRCPKEGGFVISPVLFQGRTVRLNFRTTATGFVQVEARQGDLTLLPGRSFDDCDPLSGDHLNREVTWNGMSDLGHPADSPVVLYFRLGNADLYSIEFR